MVHNIMWVQGRVERRVRRARVDVLDRPNRMRSRYNEGVGGSVG